ncbi:MAG: thymidine kinase [Clostridia bacterium]|nr:thymidine kinase [Clostridia bacterium]
MAKLYFKYGAMGSSKTASALITKFNYEERGMRVWLIKPALDDRDGVGILRSRIGLEAEGYAVLPQTDLFAEYALRKDIHVIIADECQFFTAEQIDQLRRIVDEYDIPVLCFGLRTDFLTNLFAGSRRLFEVADSITEIKTICACGKKAIVNARIDAEGRILTDGGQIMIGGNDAYVAMCHSCWKRAIKRQADEAAQK